MRAFVITLEGHEYSEAKAARCIESAAGFGLTVEKFKAVKQEWAYRTMIEHEVGGALSARRYHMWHPLPNSAQFQELMQICGASS